MGLQYEQLREAIKDVLRKELPGHTLQSDKPLLAPLEQAWADHWPSESVGFGAGWFTATQAEEFRIACRVEFDAGWEECKSMLRAGNQI